MVSDELSRITYTMHKRSLLLCESADARDIWHWDAFAFCSKTSHVCPAREKGTQVSLNVLEVVRDGLCCLASCAD